MAGLVRSGGAFVRIAGLSGAAAVALGAYGAHCKHLHNSVNKPIF